MGLDQVADHERPLEGKVDAGDQVGGQILKGEGQRDADDAGAGQQGRHRLVELQHSQGHEQADGDDGDAYQGRQQASDRLSAGDLEQSAPAQLARQPRQKAEDHDHDNRDDQIRQEGDGGFQPAAQLLLHQSEGVPDFFDGLG